VKKSEKEAKDRIRGQFAGQVLNNDQINVVTRKGARTERNEGQAVKQKFGSGLKDIAASLKKKR
jgi:hypothetical protein